MRKGAVRHRKTGTLYHFHGFAQDKTNDAGPLVAVYEDLAGRMYYRSVEDFGRAFEATKPVLESDS